MLHKYIPCLIVPAGSRVTPVYRIKNFGGQAGQKRPVFTLFVSFSRVLISGSGRAAATGDYLQNSFNKK